MHCYHFIVLFNTIEVLRNKFSQTLILASLSFLSVLMVINKKQLIILPRKLKMDENVKVTALLFSVNRQVSPLGHAPEQLFWLNKIGPLNK